MTAQNSADNGAEHTTHAYRSRIGLMADAPQLSGAVGPGSGEG